MTRRLLLVEPSATMRHVLEKHVRALGFDVESTEAYDSASDALEQQFSQFTSDFAGVIFGWPSATEPQADALAERLESPDFADLPIVVMSTDMRAATRAWVSGRPQTAMLAWKDYLGVDALLERLLDHGGVPGRQPVSTFDNGDIRVLVVDDSRTIRHSLRDLFELQGYQVGLAASAADAIAAARETRFDIAVLDYYLEETTGDVLCRDLVSDPSCGDLVCAILTGTYADHIIKRSLRAGAVECMFKNESSELLLTRIDAISRFVRQRRELTRGCDLLERSLDSVAGAVIIVGSDESIRYLSPAARGVLALSDGDDVTGSSLRDLVGSDVLPEPDAEALPLTWHGAGNAPIRVNVSRTIAAGGDESIILFERASDVREVSSAATAGHLASGTGLVSAVDPGLASAGVNSGANSGANAPDGDAAINAGQSPSDADAGDNDVARIVRSLSLDSGSAVFVDRLRRYRLTPPEAPDKISLLVMGVHERVSGSYRPLDRQSDNFRIVDEGMKRLYRREQHVACLSGHRFGLLIRHIDDPQSYLLTRRLMQLCNDLAAATSGSKLATSACLMGLASHPEVSLEQLLRTGLRGLDIVEERGLDQALLLDMKRMLTVYPATASVTPDPNPDPKATTPVSPVEISSAEDKRA